MLAIMTLDPTDYTTWTAFGDHPIFGDTKSRIADWSHDPSCYCEPDSYGQFMPECYVHIDPAPPIISQQKAAESDIYNLAATCAEIEKSFGQINYELVVLNDFTTYVWIQHAQFAIELYPNNFPGKKYILKMFIDSPDVDESEYDCQTVTEVVKALRQAIGT
jgi:hypothetical protein